MSIQAFNDLNRVSIFCRCIKRYYTDGKLDYASDSAAFYKEDTNGELEKKIKLFF